MIPRRLRHLAFLATVIALACAQLSLAQTATAPGPAQVVTAEAKVSTTFQLGYPLSYVRAPDPTPPHVVRPGTTVTLTVPPEMAVNLTGITFRKNARSVAATEGAPYTFEATQNNSGDYDAILTRTSGSFGTSVLRLHVAEFKTQPIINVSTRTRLSAANPSPTIGFVVSEAPLEPRLTKCMLLRVIGPSLAQFGVTDPVAKPTLQLFDAAGRNVTPNYGFTANVYSDGSTPYSLYRDQVAAAAAQVGAFPLGLYPDPEYAELVYLSAGTYTAVVTSGDGGAGEVLFEAYEIDPVPPRREPPPVIVVPPPPPGSSE